MLRCVLQAWLSEWLLVLLLGSFGDALDYADCMADGTKFVSDNGDCFLAVASGGVYVSHAVPACEPGGHPAFVTTMALAVQLRAMIDPLPHNKVFVGLRQAAEGVEPADGWFWELPNGGETWPATLIPWAPGEPDDSSGDRDNAAVKVQSEGITDIVNGGNTDGVICQFSRTAARPSAASAAAPSAAPKRRAVRVLSGERMTNAIAETYTDMARTLECAARCQRVPLCLAFSYSSSTQTCHIHHLDTDDPLATLETDPDFNIWAKRL